MIALRTLSSRTAAPTARSPPYVALRGAVDLRFVAIQRLLDVLVGWAT